MGLEGCNEEHQSDDLGPPALEWQRLPEIRRTMDAPIAFKSATPNWIVLSLRYPSRTGNATFVAKQATLRESAPTRTNRTSIRQTGTCDTIGSQHGHSPIPESHIPRSSNRRRMVSAIPTTQPNIIYWLVLGITLKQHRLASLVMIAVIVYCQITLLMITSISDWHFLIGI